MIQLKCDRCHIAIPSKMVNDRLTFEGIELQGKVKETPEAITTYATWHLCKRCNGKFIDLMKSFSVEEV